jgi:RNA polymerase sigma-70 factor (ECF subfamily)
MKLGSAAFPASNEIRYLNPSFKQAEYYGFMALYLPKTQAGTPTLPASSNGASTPNMERNMPQPLAKPVLSALSDLELANCIASGDKDAFEYLMRRFNRPLYRTARSILKDDSEAEDVLQEAYLLAYRNIGKFRGDSALSTWLTRIVVNEAIACLRKTRRKAEVIHLDGDTLYKAQMENMQSTGLSDEPERAAIREQARRLLEKKIDELPDAFRTVFVMRGLEEMQVEEVAKCLDIPEATVRTRFFRARGLLREALAKELDFAFEEAFSFDGARCNRVVEGVLARLHGQ